ncbi:hypothetical protein C8J56DRAFT_1051828 [Mycena floridula]|nr:hypothetical protein C8J56DRAFT_1051828 [Mycena floridula]
MRISTIQEASTSGNIQVHDDAYLVQLRQSKEEGSRLVRYVIPLFGDLLTLLRTRSCVIMRRGDLTAWTRHEVFQLGMGLFHLVMNLIWLIHKKTKPSPSDLISIAKIILITCATLMPSQPPVNPTSQVPTKDDKSDSDSDSSADGSRSGSAGSDSDSESAPQSATADHINQNV